MDEIMLRITASKSAAGAVEYFKEGLSKGDYYASGGQSVGKWAGMAAQRLGLSGEVTQEDFAALVHNQKPDGSKLNPRHSPHRKAGYDFTFSVPKSVSVVYALTGDERIRAAFEASVEETMREIEQAMRTQKGQGKAKHYPITGNMVWASFTHKTSRPVAGIADPHLHRHCYVMNTTWNAEQGRFQAGEFGILKSKAPYYEAAFQARLAYKMNALQYGIDRRGYSWEVSGLEASLLQKFSRRTAQIDALAQSEERRQGPLSAKQKDRLGALSRAKKTVEHSWGELQQTWHSWLSDDEANRIEQANAAHPGSQKKSNMSSMEAVSRAVAHLLERKTVVKETQVKAEALKRSYGQCLPEHIDHAMQKQKFHREERHYFTLLTTDEAVREENRMLAYVREGKGSQAPLNPTYRPKAEFLNEEQRQAVRHALTDSNQVTIISGRAGVGKTTLVKEIRDGVEQGGTHFFGFAPSAAASRGVMREEGFAQADTLARLLVDKELQQQTKNAVIWVDEAGLMGNKDMNRLFAIAKQQQARILLTGDVKQHASVAAGDALRILEREGGLPVARVQQIQRQRHNPRFKQVVALVAKGQADTALHQLDQMGGVIELADLEKRAQALVQSYIQAVLERKSALIVSPTHQEGDQITQTLRQQLKELGQLNPKGRRFSQLKNIHWTDEQKKDPRYYCTPDKKLTLEFHQHASGGRRKGDRWQVHADSFHAMTATRAKHTIPLPLAHSDRFTVYAQQELALAAGDKIRITKGGKTREGTRIHNGNVFTVTGFTRTGHIQLHTGKTLDKEFGHLTHGYCTTSHSAQGKTVDRVFIAQSGQSLPAASEEQFYVSISRAREMAKIFTDDKQALERSVLQSGQRMTAREIAYWQKQQQTRKQSWERTAPLYHEPKHPQHGKGYTL